MKTAAVAKCWSFASSRGGRRYQTLLYADGSTSCDCPGWCRRVAADGSRSCRHTRAILLGCADRECEGHHDYRTAAAAGAIPQMPATIATRALQGFGQPGRRKIRAAG